jgi:hypothetical protein
MMGRRRRMVRCFLFCFLLCEMKLN